MNMNKRFLNRCFCLSAGLLCLSAAYQASAGYVYRPDDFAVEVIDSVGLPGTGLYNDPQAILGRPTLAYVTGGTSHRVSVVEPAFNLSPDGGKVVTTLALNTQITVRMGRKVYDDPNNPYGIDLLVYGNSFFAGSGGAAGTGNLNTFILSGVAAEAVKVSVSQDGVNWYRYDNGPYADGMFPTNSYVWDRGTAHWTDEEADPTRPVNPALTMNNFVGKSAADAIDLYGGAAGGTGFDLAQSGFAWIQYVKVEGLSGFAGGEIDAIAAVRPIPEPVTAGLLLMGGFAWFGRGRLNRIGSK
jgi:hypothetical protein